jgi:ATP-dependent RNA helicase DOB1
LTTASSLKRPAEEGDDDATDSSAPTRAKSSKLDDEAEEESISDEQLLLAGPRIAIHTLDTLEQCTHEVAVPPDADYAPLRPYHGVLTAFLFFPLLNLIFLLIIFYI